MYRFQTFLPNKTPVFHKKTLNFNTTPTKIRRKISNKQLQFTHKTKKQARQKHKDTFQPKPMTHSIYHKVSHSLF